MRLLCYARVSMTWLLCWQALRTTSIHIVQPGVIVNGRYYWVVLLMQKCLPDIRLLLELCVFQQDRVSSLPICHARLLICWPGRLQTSLPHALTVKQPRLKSSGLQNVISNGGESLQRADQERRLTAFAYPDGLRWMIARYWHCSQAVARKCLCACAKWKVTHKLSH